MTLRATIPGEPVAKGRPKFGNGRTYTPTKTDRWEKRAAWLIRDAIKERGLDEPMTLVVDAYFARPKAHNKRRRLTREPKATKADADNIVKAVADALEKSGVIVNDSRLWHIVCRKWWCAHHEEPRVELAITRFSD